MRIPRFYQQQPLSEKTEILLSIEASHHLLRVLRLPVGKELTIFNGEGGEFSGILKGVDKKQAVVSLTEQRAGTPESKLPIALGQGISRGERMNYVIQKAVELGVTRITPLITERCEVKLSAERAEKRLAQWKSIVIHACEQSGRCHIPDVMTPTNLAQWLNEPRSGLQLVCNPQADKAIKNFNAPDAATLLIGPEGGLSQQEIEAAEKSGFYSLSLGPRILRTETATVAALTVLQNQWGDI